MDEKIFEVIKGGLGGEKGGIQEFLLLQLLTNPQGIAPSILPLLLLSGGGGFGRGRRSEMLALMAFTAASQAQAAGAALNATTSTGGIAPLPAPGPVPQSSLTTLLTAMLLMGGEERELVVRTNEDADPQPSKKSTGTRQT
jgi:hypothetical protein